MASSWTSKQRSTQLIGGPCHITKGYSAKFGRVLENLYDENRAAVYNGEERFEWFERTMGVKQGCPLRPYLLAFFIDDLIDYLPGELAGVAIKALLLADDVDLFAYSPEMLQRMINQLKNYCRV